MSPARPAVIAHRGDSDAEPEHTLAAYLAAVDAGADALECDVRLSADGHLICVHDRTVNRTSTGRGLVSTLELAELEGLDWGSWKAMSAAQNGDGPLEVPAIVERSERSHLLTLRRLLGVVRDLGWPVDIVIETKHPTRYGGLVERRLVELLDEFGLARAEPAGDGPARPGPVRVMSFSLLAIRRLRQMVPAIPVVLLMERVPLPFRDGTLPRGVEIAGISVETLRAHPRYVERAHARGHAVHVWTVNEPDDVRRCLDAGVAGIITDRPRRVLEQVQAACAGG